MDLREEECQRFSQQTEVVDGLLLELADRLQDALPAIDTDSIQGALYFLKKGAYGEFTRATKRVRF